ncbi:hypothetical protein FQA39_LY01052 [Lamprigera yunnana]|nr:hypothetical protein FQA39_LY01052 [Lamprigera yunnana]
MVGDCIDFSALCQNPPAIEIPSKEDIHPVHLASPGAIISLPKIKTKWKLKGNGLMTEFLTSTPNKQLVEKEKKKLKQMKWIGIVEKILKVEINIGNDQKITVIVAYGPIKDEAAEMKEQFWKLHVIRNNKE